MLNDPLLNGHMSGGIEQNPEMQYSDADFHEEDVLSYFPLDEEGNFKRDSGPAHDREGTPLRGIEKLAANLFWIAVWIVVALVIAWRVRSSKPGGLSCEEQCKRDAGHSPSALWDCYELCYEYGEDYWDNFPPPGAHWE